MDIFSDVPPTPSPAKLGTICHDSDEYRNPFNDFTCPDHADIDCSAWKWILDDYEVEELIKSCPVTCNATCNGNFTNATFHQNETKPVLSYLKDDSPGKASLDSSVISVLASIGFVGIFAFVIGFVVIRRRTLENTDGSFVNVVTGPLRQTRSKSNEIEESKAQNDLVHGGDERQTSAVKSLNRLDDNVDATANKTSPSPVDVESARHDQFRFIPNLNFDAEVSSDSSDSSDSVDSTLRIHEIEDDSGATYCYKFNAIHPYSRKPAANNTDFVGVHGLTTLHERSLERNSSNGDFSTCGSSVASKGAIHLLGALRSEDESEYDANSP